MDNLLADLDQPLPPEAQSLLDRFKAFVVRHPRLVEVETQLLHMIWEPADIAFVVVCGPSGVGKSTLASHLTGRLNAGRQTSTLNGQSELRALLVNVRPPDGELFNRADYYQKGLYRLGKTTYDRRITVDIGSREQMVEKRGSRRKTTPYEDNPELRDAYEEELRRLTIRAVILDEAQHLTQTFDGKRPKDQLNWIKSMTTETSVLHILIGTYDLVPFCNLDGQMARRGQEVPFSPYHIDDESDCQAFCNTFSSLLKQIPLEIDHDTLIQRWWYFFEGCIGCIGILKQWLVRALYLALREESSQLGLSHLERRILSDAKLARMSADVRSGEAELRYVGGQNGCLSNLTSMPTSVSKERDPAPTSPPEDATVNQKTRKPKGRVGGPSPHRDQVGTAQPEEESTQCSFSGPIQLEAVRWLESTVQQVQCPTCGSVSKAKVKGQFVVIASHPPRKLRAVRNVPRWMQQGSEWIFVEKKN